MQHSFYFFANSIHLVFFTVFAYLPLHVSDQSVHHQEHQMLNYTSSFWRRSLRRWSVVGGRWCYKDRCNNFSSFITWRLFTAQHVSGVLTPIIRNSTTAV